MVLSKMLSKYLKMIAQREEDIGGGSGDISNEGSGIAINGGGSGCISDQPVRPDQKSTSVDLNPVSI